MPKLALLFYPFAASAVWINLFMASLLLSWLGPEVLSPARAIWVSLGLGVPAAWAAARWIRRLLERT
ncbi:hypothetical protein [Paracoccus sp. (in: a-proteobacteria)]|uniref:hypothetical protein n=1 Tax=Paracoccus sp. TaxID=267 RepID=UPI003220308E